MTNFIDKLEDTTVMRLGEIIRYNNRPKIKHENVAEHCLYVATTVIKICNYYNIDSETRSKALEFAITHDLGEIFLGDIPYDTKVDNPGLDKILEKAEVNSLKKYMPDYADIYSLYLKEEEERTLPYLITKLADTTSVLQYSKREITLGNRSDEMKGIYEGAVSRVTKILEEIESLV